MSIFHPAEDKFTQMTQTPIPNLVATLAVPTIIRENNAGWRIDYFLVSDRLRDRVAGASILSDVYGSDHCPVCLELRD